MLAALAPPKSRRGEITLYPPKLTVEHSAAVEQGPAPSCSDNTTSALAEEQSAVTGNPAMATARKPDSFHSPTLLIYT